jgi:hypothetical protein
MPFHQEPVMEERVHMRQTSDGAVHITSGNFYGRSKPFTVKFADAGPIGLTFIEVGAAVMKVVDATGVAHANGVQSGDHILSINGVQLSRTPRLCNSKYVGNMIRTQPRPLIMAFVRPRVALGGGGKNGGVGKFGGGGFREEEDDEDDE